MPAEPQPGNDFIRIHRGNTDGFIVHRDGSIELPAPVKHVKVSGVLSFDPVTRTVALLPPERSSRAC